MKETTRTTRFLGPLRALAFAAFALAAVAPADAQESRLADRYAARGVVATPHGASRVSTPARVVPRGRTFRSDVVRVGRTIEHCPPQRIWIPGAYCDEVRRVWVPERVERTWIEPIYQVRVDRCGTETRVLVQAGYWTDVIHPAHFEARTVRVWVPGHWAFR